MTQSPLTFGDHKIGKGEKTFLIAELSANHDKDLDQALALVDIAADTGWDCVKFQTYDADTLTVPSTHPSMAIDASWGRTDLRQLYEDAHMPMDFHAPLFQRAKARGLVPFTSVYDPRDLQFVEDLGCEIYKIASFEMTFDDLLAEIARTAKPVIMSTGMANLAEVAHAIDILHRHGAGPIVLLHCVSSYPTPADQVNLASMATLESEFGCPVGFSDHTIGAQVALAASAMGAVALEKHVTNDPHRPGPDHRFSATPDVMRDIADGVALIHQMRGSPGKGTGRVEQGNRDAFRRSAFTVRALPAGHVITEADFRFVRPNAGIPATDKAALLGKVLNKDLPDYWPITYDDVTG